MVHVEMASMTYGDIVHDLCGNECAPAIVGVRLEYLKKYSVSSKKKNDFFKNNFFFFWDDFGALLLCAIFSPK